MAIKTFKNLYDDIGDSCRETQIDTQIKDWVNLTLMEINDPAWAFEQIGIRGFNQLWTFNRRKDTFNTVASTQFYQLPRDLDKIGLIRQTTSPAKLRYIPDEVFYRYIPNPTATGNPLYYRIWEEEGVSVRLATDDTLEVLSSSASDGSSFTVSVIGYDTNGLLRSEVFTLNGTTAVAGSVTFDAGRPLKVSKSATTTGVITVREATSDIVLVRLAPEEKTTRFKIIGLYPIPGSAITVSLEYYTRIRMLVNDTDAPDIDEKWIWVVRAGGMAKVYQYQGKETLFNSTQALYASGVRSMVKADMQEPDYIPVLRNINARKFGVVTFDDTGYGDYGLTF